MCICCNTGNYNNYYTSLLPSLAVYIYIAVPIGVVIIILIVILVTLVACVVWQKNHNSKSSIQILHVFLAYMYMTLYTFFKKIKMCLISTCKLYMCVNVSVVSRRTWPCVIFHQYIIYLYPINILQCTFIVYLWLEYHLLNFCRETWSKEKFFKCKITILFCILFCILVTILYCDYELLTVDASPMQCMIM